ncbi:MAG: hypothetical protein JXR37_08745 [Kiritimatiellae bacterium]|nr:hypothetical protein [Kiritimatiellia bacterium]
MNRQNGRQTVEWTGLLLTVVLTSISTAADIDTRLDTLKAQWASAVFVQAGPFARIACVGVDVEDERVEFVLALDKQKPGNSKLGTVFLFTDKGDGYVLERASSFGGRAEGKTVEAEVWACPLVDIATRELTLSVFVAGEDAGLRELPPVRVSQSLTKSVVAARSRLLARLEKSQDGESPELTSRELLGLAGQSGNKGTEALVRRLALHPSKDVRDMCVCLLARSKRDGSTTEELIRASLPGGEGEKIIEEIRILKSVFAAGSDVDTLLKVAETDNDEAKEWVLVRLAHQGKKDLFSGVKPRFSWTRTNTLLPALSALADARKGKN